MTLNEIPKDWAICPNGKCPMADTCLRHEAYQAVAGRTDVWSSVLPEALQADGTCQRYRETKLLTIARGFKGICDMLHSRDASHEVRIALTDYFGSRGSYYRARDGVRPLSPDDQQYIRDLVARYGYTEGVEFDGYEHSYNF